jgi:hypothetical protein
MTATRSTKKVKSSSLGWATKSFPDHARMRVPEAGRMILALIDTAATATAIFPAQKLYTPLAAQFPALLTNYFMPPNASVKYQESTIDQPTKTTQFGSSTTESGASVRPSDQASVHLPHYQSAGFVAAQWHFGPSSRFWPLGNGVADHSPDWRSAATVTQRTCRPTQSRSGAGEPRHEIHGRARPAGQTTATRRTRNCHLPVGRRGSTAQGNGRPCKRAQ